VKLPVKDNTTNSEKLPEDPQTFQLFILKTAIVCVIKKPFNSSSDLHH